jgi:hypothetical protein
MRLVAGFALALTLGTSFALATTAGADTSGSDGSPRPGASVDNGRPTAVVVSDASGEVARWESPRRGSGGGGSRWTCGYVEAYYRDAGGIEVDDETRVTVVPGEYFVFLCRDESGAVVEQRVVYWEEGSDPLQGLVGAERAAEEALAGLVVADPVVATSPTVGLDQLVGLESWLWVDDWSAESASATLGGVTSTVSAAPVSLVWSPGDGSEVECDGPGVPWSKGRSSSGACTHTFSDRSTASGGGVWEASVTVVWDVSWVASTGESGDLGELTTSTAWPVRVVEAQGVIGG